MPSIRPFEDRPVLGSDTAALRAALVQATLAQADAKALELRTGAAHIAAQNALGSANRLYDKAYTALLEAMSRS